MSDDMMRDGAMDEPVNGGPTGGGASLPAGCAAFDAALADYLEGTLAPTARAEMDAHRTLCTRCDALATDLEGIVDAARSLPALAPSSASTEAMWRGVSSRIEAPTVSIDRGSSARRAPAVGGRMRFDGWRRQLVAAAALVLVTAGVTYTVTHRIEQNQQVASGSRGPGTEHPTPAPSVPAPVPDSNVSRSQQQQLASAPNGLGAGTVNATNVSSATPRGRSSAVVARSSATVTYEREIAQLRRILTERRGELDSTTVAVVEGNLAVIDLAIKQSREALARDPRSRFLGEQLNSALDKKLELLRTAALLPART